MNTLRLANRAAARSVRQIKHGQLLGSRAIANTAARSLGVHAPAVLRSQASLLSTARSVDHSDQEWTASAASPPFDPSDEATVQAWTERFLDAVRDVPAATDPARSAAVLRELVKSNLLSFTDMRDAPEKFFLAHRLLATVGLGGFGVRFTVQFNLFAGSIVGLGGPEQVASLRDIQAAGQLGCFLLTEAQAGVLSGLIVETTCEWDAGTQEFVLHTPSDKAAKNWISQGYTAERGVVIADLVIGGESHGPHAFLLSMRDAEGQLLPGITVEDMGTKTVANDLDNARVWFDKVRLPKEAMLNKFADVREDAYVQTTDERMRIEVIGQRLLTGRLAIAEAALASCSVLHLRTEEYARGKVCNGLAGEVRLSEMPQLKAVFRESEAALDEMAAFTAGVEQRLNSCLRAGTIPDADLVDAIAVAKIRCIDVALERAHALRKEVGSYALMHATGFELVDMLLCCKFAEGDSRILQQKLTRDRLKALQKGGAAAALSGLLGEHRAEVFAAANLARKLQPAGRDVAKLAAAMDEHWREIYDLAEMIAERHIRTGPRAAFVEGPSVERLTPAATGFDADWKGKLGAPVA
mmetsp:Transcript_4345/g.13334  ORF Transcript_4345/g.13334 Transcript_4345/m.13334 type:complete len:582 (-) Transcript_4345:108-1853(-)